MSVDLEVHSALDSPEISLTGHLSGQKKAAIAVRLLLQSGTVPALAELSESLQAELTLQLVRMAPVDQITADAVAVEFADAIEAIGLSFPNGLEDALGLLEGVISDDASRNLRSMSSDRFQSDPWESIRAADIERLVPILESESVEVAAILLSKLKVSKAAELLGCLSGERARRIAYAVSQTASVAPNLVRRIGVTLAEQMDVHPNLAFPDGPVSRVGAILNYSPASVRDEMLTGLDSDDNEFAEQVCKAIFTFADIKDRVSSRDVPRIQRDLDQADLMKVVATAEGADKNSVDFLLENISQRLADSIREEAAEKGSVPLKDSEAAMMRIVNVIRDLESAGEIALVTLDD
ncbi:MAG: FliG C-terminal domain-containing protein [Boseongicola sp.]